MTGNVVAQVAALFFILAGICLMLRAGEWARRFTMIGVLTICAPLFLSLGGQFGREILSAGRAQAGGHLPELVGLAALVMCVAALWFVGASKRHCPAFWPRRRRQHNRHIFSARA
jgi:hypothetical protein